MVSGPINGCGLEVALSVMGGKWKPLILFHLHQGPSRFGQLKRLVRGISEKVLIQQLREMTDAGVIVRRDFREVPPKVEYEMTEFGSTLALALKPLCVWGEKNRLKIAKIQTGGTSGAGPTESLPKRDS